MADEQIIVRPAVQTDVPQLVTLIRRSWLVTWAPELPFSAVQHFARVNPAADYASAMWASFQVAMQADRLLAMVHVADDRVAAVHVDPTAKGRGIGTRLMDWAEQRIRNEHPVARLEVRTFNIAAQEFYRRRHWIEKRRYMDTECGCLVETLELHKLLT